MPVPPPPSPWKLVRSRREGECFFCIGDGVVVESCAYSVVDFIRTRCSRPCIFFSALVLSNDGAFCCVTDL